MLEYYEAGQLWRDYSYVDGNQQGTQLEYYKSGQLYNEYNKIDGKINGNWLEYYFSGQLKQINSYVNDNRHGKQL